jgi:hypothetical protein
VHLPLEVNFVGFVSGRHLFVLISSDTLFGSELLEAHISAELDATIPDCCPFVISTATHTHFAPSLEKGKVALGAADSGWQANVASRVSAAVQSAAEEARRSTAVPVIWQSATTDLPLAVSRRRRWRWPVLSKRTLLRFPRVVMAPEPANPINSTARLAILRDPAGQPYAILVNWAAHPTVYPHREMISPDYIGTVREFLRRKLAEPNLPVLYLQGFAGDIRPKIESASKQSFINLVMRGPSFPSVTEDEWQCFADTLADAFGELVDTAAKTAPLRLDGAPAFTKVDAPLSDMLDGETLGRNVQLRHVRLAVGLDLVFVNAEPSSELVHHVHARWRDAWSVGYAGDVFGYWPTSQQCREGGYEAGGFFPYFDLKGHFRHNTTEIFNTLIERLAHQAGSTGQQNLPLPERPNPVGPPSVPQRWE